MEGTERLVFKVTLLVSGGNMRRTQDMCLSAMYFLSRWTKADNSRETFKSKNADVTKRSANPRDFGSGFQAKVLCAQRKALAPVHLCMLSCPLTQPRRKLHSLLRFPVCFPGGVLSAYNLSLPHTCSKNLPVLEESQFKCHSLQNLI